MVAMVLGLMVAGAAVSLLLSFNRTYATTESLSRIQENARVAFELMARELRQSAGNPCSRFVPVANVINNANAKWWADWSRGLRGFDNGELEGSLVGTDAIETRSGALSLQLVASHDPEAATIELSTSEHGFAAGDVLLVCDHRQVAIFQASAVSGVSISHLMGGVSPGNCTQGLGFRHPMVCDEDGSRYKYADGSVVAKLAASRWFVASNDRGGTSLYRRALRGSAETPNEEIVEGVEDLQVSYLVGASTSYVDGTAVGSWSDVSSVRIALTLAGNVRVDGSGEPIRRTLVHVVSIRNRNP
jgi:type IV pilus assembly protein PilW